MQGHQGLEEPVTHSEEQREHGGDKAWSWGLHGVSFGDAPGGKSHGAGLGVLTDPVGCDGGNQSRAGDRAWCLQQVSTQTPMTGMLEASRHGDIGEPLPAVPT